MCSGFVEHCRPDEKERQKTQHPFEAVAPLEEVQDLAAACECKKWYSYGIQ